MSTVITGMARTPIGRYGGALSSLRAAELGAGAIAAAVERSGGEASSIEEVVFGHVLQAGHGQITSRQAAARAGLPTEVPCLTENKVRLSELGAIGIVARGTRGGGLRRDVAEG